MRTPGKEINIIIADDHPIFRGGMKQIIEEDERISILAETDNGESALELIRKMNPDVAVLDIDMPFKTGLEVLRELKDPMPKIIFLTIYADEDIYDEAMDLGISGYVLKDSAVSDIIDCIHKVFEGKFYISPSVSNFLISRKNRINKFAQKKTELHNLTKTEIIILKLISEGKTSKKISGLLKVSFKTIENHRTNISTKLNLKGSNSLLQFAIENKIVISEY